MTIPAGQTSITRHTGNGTADTFDYEFKITDQTELLVTITDTNGVATVQALTTDYTVSGVGDNDGGSITLVAGALTTGYTFDPFSANIINNIFIYMHNFLSF